MLSPDGGRLMQFTTVLTRALPMSRDIPNRDALEAATDAARSSPAIRGRRGGHAEARRIRLGRITVHLACHSCIKCVDAPSTEFRLPEDAQKTMVPHQPIGLKFLLPPLLHVLEIHSVGF